MSKVLNVNVLQRLFILHVMHEFTYRVDGSLLVTIILQIEFKDLEWMGFALAYGWIYTVGGFNFMCIRIVRNQFI